MVYKSSEELERYDIYRNRKDRPMYDRTGLERAYQTRDGLYQHGSNLYVAGTRDFGDVIDDLKLPFDRGAKNSKRYAAVKKYLESHPEIKNVIGHSLGGAVSLEANKQNPGKYNITTYGSPAVNSILMKNDSNIKRFRNSGDPISIFDGKANDMSGKPIWNQQYLPELIKNRANPLDPLRFLNYNIKQHSYKNSDNITKSD